MKTTRAAGGRFTPPPVRRDVRMLVQIFVGIFELIAVFAQTVKLFRRQDIGAVQADIVRGSKTRAYVRLQRSKAFAQVLNMCATDPYRTRHTVSQQATECTSNKVRPASKVVGSSTGSALAPVRSSSISAIITSSMSDSRDAHSRCTVSCKRRH